MNSFLHRLPAVAGAVAALVLGWSQAAPAAPVALLSRTYQVADACRIRTNNKNKASLGDLRPGQKVMIRYQEQEGRLVADLIVEEKPPAEKPPQPRSPGEGLAMKMVKPRDPAQPPPAPRARGVITAVDQAARSVTINERQRAKPDRHKTQ